MAAAAATMEADFYGGVATWYSCHASNVQVDHTMPVADADQLLQLYQCIWNEVHNHHCNKHGHRQYMHGNPTWGMGLPGRGAGTLPKASSCGLHNTRCTAG
jgi:hypothetical protein